MGANMGQWLMHERLYFRLMAAAKCTIRPEEEKEEKKKCKQKEKKWL